MHQLRSALAAPLLILHLLTSHRDLIDADVARWTRVKGRTQMGVSALLMCLSEQTHEFRNLYYHRGLHGNAAGKIAATLLRLFYRPELSLQLSTSKIGPGLFIQHGVATIVAAESIGADCWINQQVTIGYRAPAPGERLRAPRLGDNVTITCGAKVLGDIEIGDGAVVGANAVVVKDVPSGQVAVGIPAVNRSAGVHAEPDQSIRHRTLASWRQARP